MKTKIHDVAIHGKLDDLAKKLDEQLQQLPLGQQPSINRYLVEWGMDPTKASKYKPREAIKLLCILHDSAMTMRTLQQYHHAHQLQLPRKG